MIEFHIAVQWWEVLLFIVLNGLLGPLADDIGKEIVWLIRRRRERRVVPSLGDQKP